MFLTYIQHIGCPTRSLVPTPASSELQCPDCYQYFSESSWTDNPLPCPFVQQTAARCAVLIKPTRGDFTSYKIGEDLHIGVSDSTGVVHSYWMNGVMSEPSTWDNSILVSQFEPSREFDDSLYTFLNNNSQKFLGNYYNDIHWNCFDMILEFFRYINFRQYTKVEFVSEFVQAPLKMVLKYCSLVKKVKERGYILIA